MSGGRLIKSLRKFCTAVQGNITVTFGLVLLPIVAGAGAAVDYSQANSIKSAMQAAGDATALALVKQAGTLTGAEISSNATSYFQGNFNRSSATNVSVSSSYDSATLTLTVNATASYPTTILAAAGIKTVALSSTSKATTAGKTYSICVMITNPDHGHTELTSNGAGLVLKGCMNQVNTNDWDAVQANDNSYIHGTAASNCFVGDIHFGDVTPPKEASCTLFPDPFSSLTMPASAANCDYGWLGSMGPKPPGQPGKKTVNVNNTVLNPGTYCQGLTIQNVANVTFSPGLYIINGGLLQISGPAGYTNVTANGVTILFTGANTGMTVQKANLTMSPSTTAGNFSNFLFYLDQAGCPANCVFNGGKANPSTWTDVTMNASGIIYLVNQEFDITSDTKGSPLQLTLNPGALIADMILPDGNLVVTVTGYPLNQSGTPGQLQKTSLTGGPARLIQ